MIINYNFYKLVQLKNTKIYLLKQIKLNIIIIMINQMDNYYNYYNNYLV